jgi:uncharacterized protein
MITVYPSHRGGREVSVSTTPPALAETHISWVLLTEDRALKFAKPVRTDVLDQSTVERRRSNCAREVELNSRIAPDVYLGVGEVVLDGAALEPVVVMRRMPDSRRLSGLLDDPEVADRVREVARAVAAFHGRVDAVVGDAAVDVAGADALKRRWDEDLAAMSALCGTATAERIDWLHDRADTYIEGRRPLFDERIASGMVRDGHGDLLADDIFCLDDGPRILDCLAFSDSLRVGDVLADVAFLVMDLVRLGHPELGRLFLRTYCEHSGEHHPGSLAHLYVAQRALVRAKVSALRATPNPRSGLDPQVETLLDLAAEHLDRATVRLALVGGLPGSGKSTLASRLSDDAGWVVLSSDEIRRDLGLREADLHDQSAYAATNVARVYAELRARATWLLTNGVSVLLDATWSSAAERELARAAARVASAEIIEMRCDAPPDLCRARIAARSAATESEATPAVVDEIDVRADPWPEALVVDTSREVAGTRTRDRHLGPWTREQSADRGAQ